MSVSYDASNVNGPVMYDKQENNATNSNAAFDIGSLFEMVEVYTNDSSMFDLKIGLYKT